MAVSGCALADEVIFRNGDKLTGEIKSADGGTLVIVSKVAGEVRVKMEDVQTFSTDKPIEMHLADGTVLKQPVVQAAPGQVSTPPGGAVQAKDVPVATIKTINPPPVKWTGAVLAGAVVTRGNSHTDNLNVGAEATRRAAEDRISLNGNYNYGSEETNGTSTVSTDQWLAAAKYDYFLSPKWYAYGNIVGQSDHVANLGLRVTPGAGAGYQWVESAKTNFSTEAGLTYVYEQYTDPDTINEFPAARLAYHYDRQLSDGVKLVNNLELLPSLDTFGDYLLTFDLGVRAVLTGSLFGEFKVVLQQNTNPPAGVEQWDTRMVVNIGYQF